MLSLYVLKRQIDCHIFNRPGLQPRGFPQSEYSKPLSKFISFERIYITLFRSSTASQTDKKRVLQIISKIFFSASLPARNRWQHNKNPLHIWRNWKNIIQITRCFHDDSIDSKTSLLSPLQEKSLTLYSIKHPSRFSTKNLNITSKHLKSSHSKNEKTHSTIICCLSKSNPYSCLDIARQKKESATAIVTATKHTRNLTSLLQKTFLYRNRPFHWVIDLSHHISHDYHSPDILQRTSRYLYILFHIHSVRASLACATCPPQCVIQPQGLMSVG